MTSDPKYLEISIWLKAVPKNLDITLFFGVPSDHKLPQGHRVLPLPCKDHIVTHLLVAIVWDHSFEYTMILPFYALVSGADEHSTVHSKNCGRMMQWLEGLRYDGPQHQEAYYNDLKRKTIPVQ